MFLAAGEWDSCCQVMIKVSAHYMESKTFHCLPHLTILIRFYKMNVGLRITIAKKNINMEMGEINACFKKYFHLNHILQTMFTHTQRHIQAHRENYAT